jgi:ribulose-phosphate 3-epimerase
MSYRGIEISASVMCMDWLNMMEQIKTLEELGIDYLHFDIMDGDFVPELSMGPSISRFLKESTTIPSDYHIMVEEPRYMFEHFLFDQGSYFSIHYEACRNLHRELVHLRKMGFQPGLVLNPATTLENIEYVIDEVSSILIMTVNPGYVGQQVIPQVLNKIKKLNKWRKKMNQKIRIAVDGNVSFKNIPSMVTFGADVLVVGTSSLFSKKGSLEENYKQLVKSIDAGLAIKEQERI